MDQNKIAAAQTTASTPKTMPSFFSLVKAAVEHYKRVWKTMVKLECLGGAAAVGAYILVIAAAFLTALAADAIKPTTIVTLFECILIVTGGSGILYVISWFSAAAIIVLRDKQDSLTIREATRRAKPYVLGYLGLSVLSILIIFAGSLLFIIPGIIFTIWFMFWEYAFIVDGVKGFAVLKKSREYVRGSFWEVFVLTALGGMAVFFINIFLEILNYIPPLNIASMVISIVIWPLYQIYFYLMYENLKKIKMGETMVASSSGSDNKKLAVGLAAAGLVASLIIIAIAVYYGPQIQEQFKQQVDEYNAQHEPQQSLPQLH